jgi:hypothetical protein
MSDLDFYKRFNVHTWSDYPEVNECVNDLYEILKGTPEFKVGNEIIKKKHLKVVILDLWATWLIDPKMYISYSRDKSAYAKIGRGNKRYNKIFISFKSVAVIDALKKGNYIENVIGFNDRVTGKSRMSRMRAKKKLIKLIEKNYKLKPSMIQFARNKECLILRDANKDDVNYRDTKERKKMRENLYEYNNLLRRTFIDIPHFPKNGITLSDGKKCAIDHNEKFVCRIFNNKSWTDGGRFYGGWWQRIPKKWREEIRINNEPTVEIDYSGLHIVLLYAKEGIDYWKSIKNDPYEIKGYEDSDRMRSFLKQVLLTIINAKDEKSAIQSLRQEISITKKTELGWVVQSLGWKKLTDENIKALLDDFIAPHKPIQKFFFSGAGVNLQNWDSMIAEQVIIDLACITEVPVLCIHDSFIVGYLYEDILKSAMSTGFQRIIKNSKIVPKMKDQKWWDMINWYSKGKTPAEKAKRIKERNKVFIEPLEDSGYKIRYSDWKKTAWDKKYYTSKKVKYLVT